MKKEVSFLLWQKRIRKQIGGFIDGGNKKISILIVDDHNLIREVWSYILNKYKGFEVVGDCGTAEEAIEKAGILRPDIVLLDLMLPGMIGIDAIQEIIDISPNSKILGVSMHTHPRYARLMIKKAHRAI